MAGRHSMFVRFVLAMLALGPALFLLGRQPAAAVGKQSAIRQLAGAIPDPYANPVAVTKVGDVLFVLDAHGIDRVDLVNSDLSVFVGRQFVAGSVDGIGGAARLRKPQGITTDGSSLFVADTANHTIRKIEIATGAVTTIAGKAGKPGSVDGIGSVARFNAPFGISYGGGSLWISDKGNATIRRMTLATGEVVSVAGKTGVLGTVDGTGRAARFTAPRGVALDGDQLLIADYVSVRTLATGTGEVRTVANLRGSLRGIAASAGSIFTTKEFADDGTGCIYEVNPSTGTFSCVWFSASGLYQGVAVEDGRLFAAHSDDRAVREFDLATRQVHSLAGFGETGASDGTGAAARFFFPHSIASDGTELYVATLLDEGSPAGALRKVEVATGAVTTMLTAASGPNSLTADAANVYFSDGSAVKRLVLSTGEVTTIADLPVGPAAMATDGTSLYMASNCAISRLDVATGGVTTVAGTPGACGHQDGAAAMARFDGPSDLSITPDGKALFVVEEFPLCCREAFVRKVALASGTVSTFRTFDSQPFATSPRAATTDGINLYVVGCCLGIQKTSLATGATVTIAPPLGTASGRPLTYVPRPAAETTVHQLLDVAVDAQGRLMFADLTGVGIVG